MSNQTQTILITGATSGIGRHAAIHLAKQGHRVFATGRNAERMASLRAECDGLPLEVMPLDVTDAESIQMARTEVERRTGGAGVDVLINNAGFGHLAPTELVSDADLRAQFETNVFGLMAVTRAFLPQMKRKGAGRILNVSSIGGRVSMPLAGVYSATKYAVEALSDALRNELAAIGIDVVLIEPGPIDTGFGEISMGIVEQYRGRAAEYEHIVGRAQQIKAQTDRIAADPKVVTRAIDRAITSRRPRARYVAPFSSSLMVSLTRALPTSLTDWFMRQALGLTRRRMLPAAQQA